MPTSIDVKFPSSFSRDSSHCNCHPLSCIHLLFWLCFQAFGRVFSQTCKRLRRFAQLHQNIWANANSSPKLFGFPCPILPISGCTTVVILLDVAHVVAGYGELAKRFQPIRNTEIVQDMLYMR